MCCWLCPDDRASDILSLVSWTRKLLPKTPPFRDPVSMSVDNHGMSIGYFGFPDEGSRRLSSPGQAKTASLPSPLLTATHRERRRTRLTARVSKPNINPSTCFFWIQSRILLYCIQNAFHGTESCELRHPSCAPHNSRGTSRFAHGLSPGTLHCPCRPAARATTGEREIPHRPSFRHTNSGSAGEG